MTFDELYALVESEKSERIAVRQSIAELARMGADEVLVTEAALEILQEPESESPLLVLNELLHRLRRILDGEDRPRQDADALREGLIRRLREHGAHDFSRYLQRSS